MGLVPGTNWPTKVCWLGYLSLIMKAMWSQSTCLPQAGLPGGTHLLSTVRSIVLTSRKDL